MADGREPDLREVEAKAFAVVRSRGPAWDRALPMEEQVDWHAHATFMDDLAAKGVIRLGGPLQGTEDVLLVVFARDTSEIAERLADDPWTRSGLLVLKDCRPWQVRLGSLPGPSPIPPPGNDG